MRLWAIVPVKDFDAAKSRLGPTLDSEKRADFAKRLFDHVTAQLAQHPEVERVLIVSNSEAVRSHAVGRGCLTLEDPAAGSTLAEVVDSALGYAAAHGASHGLVLMGDLPRLSQRSLSLLTGALAEHPQVIAPDQHGVATNALGLRLPAPAGTAFGSGKSLELHRQRFPAALLIEDAELAFDVDDPQDFAALPPPLSEPVASEA
ncbi:MAG: 2-phospho-L-lactate guanylyltransferase [Polyangiaceae bacterium]|nr:2-phospho-L-lactate guanylyltransferase [Myxococcales bacterium]MCB9586623.1 2-phospho-L-lactate guanylyltransferase [Polyangiaceae bacterium]MCB9606130.1 2-phospho-L-lactate guanylyltransferase [Polyangiaceae bacterium]